jgi:TRAP-type C4-dicarboxylate transport system permease small subunit
MERFIDVSTKALAVIGCLALFAMVVVGAIDVIGRYVFNNAVTGAVEISKLLMATVIAFTWAYTQANRGHARVEFIIQRFPRGVQRVLTILGDVLIIAFFALVGYQLAKTGVEAWQEHRRILLLEIPIAIMYWLVSFTAFVTCAVVVLQLVRGSRSETPAAHHEAGQEVLASVLEEAGQDRRDGKAV